MSLKRFTVAAIIALSAIAANAQAGVTWTVTTQGTILVGADFEGVFGGPAFSDLAGKRFTQSVTISVDQADWPGHYTDPYSGYADLSGAGAAFTDTVTIGDVSVTFHGIAQNGGQRVANGITAGHGYQDYIFSYEEGESDAGYLLAHHYASSHDTSFVPFARFDQNLGVILDPTFDTYSTFSLSGAHNVYFEGRPDSITVSSNAVPEPASLALLGLGLAGVALSRRRFARSSYGQFPTT